MVWKPAGVGAYDGVMTFLKMRKSVFPVALLLSVLLTGCGNTEPAESTVPVTEPVATVDAEPATQTLTVTLVPEQGAFNVPNGGIIRVELQDVTDANAPTNVIAVDQILISRGVMPEQFTLEFVPADIGADNVYGVLAYIYDAQGEPIWNSYGANLVLTGGNPMSDIEVTMISISDEELEPVGIANPAAVACVDAGGESEIRTDSAGNQYGMCVLNGQECDEWELFYGECTFDLD